METAHSEVVLFLPRPVARQLYRVVSECSDWTYANFLASKGRASRDFHQCQADRMRTIAQSLRKTLEETNRVDFQISCGKELAQWFYTAARDRENLFRLEFETREPGAEAREFYFRVWDAANELTKVLATHLV